jgi:NAD-dependent DNA ligase
VYYTEYQIEQNIREFKERIREDRDFCEDLYYNQTIFVLCYKYSYYVSGKYLVNDDVYDATEKSWYVMGRALGHLKKEQTSPCIDFDNSHPLAQKGIVLHDRLPEKTGKELREWKRRVEQARKKKV